MASKAAKTDNSATEEERKTRLAIEPLLRVGAFGTHLHQPNNRGSYVWAGDVPEYFRGTSFGTYSDGLLAFADWFASRGDAFKSEHRPGLRADVAALVESRELAAA